MKKVTEAWLEAAADDLRVIEKIATDELGACPKTPFCHFERSVAKREILKTQDVMEGKISRYRSK